MILKREACFVGGRWQSADRWIDVEDPATGERIGRVPDAPAELVDEAISAAQGSMAAWAALPARGRSEVLLAFEQLVRRHEQEMAHLLTSEQGKPLHEARAEIHYAADYIRWFAEEGNRVYGDVIASRDPDKRLLVLKQPVGVVAAITPWNFPAAMVARKIAPALAAGCGVVLKPSELTPFTALALAALADEAGVPAGLLNVVTGDGAPIGQRLTGSPIVRKLSFTGSTAVGVKLFEQCAATMKRMSLELGGNAPFIVFDDADLDAAVDGAVASKFRNAGQTCVCANRFYVQDGIHDAFLQKFAERASELRLGHGSRAATDLGPLINDRAVRRVSALVADALASGARPVVGGSRAVVGGNFFEPTVLADATSEMLVAREEIFGPVAPVIRFRDEASAIAMANAADTGLAAYIFSRNLSRIWRVAEALQVGMVGANSGVISTEVAPFGGVKSSGLGREGSRYGLDEYLDMKYLCLTL